MTYLMSSFGLFLVKFKVNSQLGVAPGKSMGGDIFANKEGLLPSAPGRTWYEADINYISGYRGNDRIVYSSDGLLYKTSDHYKTFTEMKQRGYLLWKQFNQMDGNLQVKR